MSFLAATQSDRMHFRCGDASRTGQFARFDEENNLEWVDRLRDEGVEVITEGTGSQGAFQVVPRHPA